jgi:FkbM family methyltransferase
MSKTYPDWVTLPSGSKIYVDVRDYRGRVLLDTAGNFNPNSVKLWNLILSKRKWPNVIDVGSNYGEMLALANIRGASKVFAFEPNPEVLPFLKKSIRTLPFKVHLFEEAVSNMPYETIDFFIDQVWSGTSKLSELDLCDSSEFRWRKVSVPCTSIDSKFKGKLNGGFAMKIDVEGHEVKILQGAAEVMNEASEWIVMLEILHMSIRDIARLGRRKKLFLFNLEDLSLVRVPSLNFLKLRRMLRNPKYYQQDAVIASSGKFLF